MGILSQFTTSVDFPLRIEAQEKALAGCVDCWELKGVFPPHKSDTIVTFNVASRYSPC